MNKFIVFVALVTCTFTLSCPSSQQAHVSNLWYPSSMNQGCPTLQVTETNKFTSFHYRNACKNQYSLPSLPSAVYEIEVTACLNADVTPSKYWSSGLAFNASVCCFPIQ